MSRGPGWLQRAIEQTFVEYPWEKFTVCDLWWAASSRRRPIERGSELTPPTAAQRRSVLRAADAVLRHRCDKWCATRVSRELVFHHQDVPLQQPGCGNTIATQFYGQPRRSGSTQAMTTEPDILERIQAEAYPEPDVLTALVKLAAPPATKEAKFSWSLREIIAALWIGLYYEGQSRRPDRPSRRSVHDAIDGLRDIWKIAHGKEPALISKRGQRTKGLFLDLVRAALGPTLLKYNIGMDLENAVRSSLYGR